MTRSHAHDRRRLRRPRRRSTSSRHPGPRRRARSGDLLRDLAECKAQARRGPGDDPRGRRMTRAADDPQALAHYIAGSTRGDGADRGPARGGLPPLLRAPRQARPGQHAAGRPRRQAVPRPRHRLLRPAPGGLLRPPRGDRPLRPDPRDQAGHLRHLVDPPVDAAGRRRRGLPGPAQPAAPPPARPEPGRARPAARPAARRAAPAASHRDDPPHPHRDPADDLARRHARRRLAASACSRR